MLSLWAVTWKSMRNPFNVCGTDTRTSGLMDRKSPFWRWNLLLFSPCVMSDSLQPCGLGACQAPVSSTVSRSSPLSSWCTMGSDSAAFMDRRSNKDALPLRVHGLWLPFTEMPCLAFRYPCKNRTGIPSQKYSLGNQGLKLLRDASKDSQTPRARKRGRWKGWVPSLACFKILLTSVLYIHKCHEWYLWNQGCKYEMEFCFVFLIWLYWVLVAAACGIFQDQGLNLHPLNCKADTLPLSHQASLKWSFFLKVFIYKCS